MKRILITIGVYLFAALSLNLLVALACAIIGQQCLYKQVRTTPDLTRSDFSKITSLVVQQPLKAVPQPAPCNYVEQFGYHEVLVSCMYFGDRENIEVGTLMEIASGWPWKSLRYRNEIQRTDLKGGVKQSRRAQQRGPRVISQDANYFYWPTKPIWKGFIYNSLVYFAILITLLLVPWLFRRWIRLKRGLCPRCAYPIGISEHCSECGAPVPAKTQRLVARRSAS